MTDEHAPGTDRPASRKGQWNAWPADQLEHARRRWDEGASATVIAREFTTATRTVTRSMILGLSHRHGWGKRATATVIAPPGRHKNARPAKANAAAVAPPDDDAPPTTPDAPVNLAAFDVPAGASRLLRIEQLTDGDCRWPHGDRAPFLFCGDPVESDCVYCPRHARRAYNRPRVPASPRAWHSYAARR